MPPRKRAAAVTESPAGLAVKVAETLEKLTLRPEDAALAELAQEYARTIDRAHIIAARAAKIPFDPDSAEEVKRLAQRVSAQATMGDLGPKLLAALDALGATPKARSQSPKPVGKSGPSALDALRGAA